MEVYSYHPVDTTQALDFSVSSKKDFCPESADCAVLDLSCKKAPKHDHQIESYSLSPVSLENHSLSPTRYEHHHSQGQETSPEEERKSPVEERPYMVTPPSESESSSAKKLLPIYPPMYSSPTDISHRYPLIHLPASESETPSPDVPLSLTMSSESASHIPGYPSPSTSVPSNINPLLDHSAVDALKKTARPFKAYPKDPLALIISQREFIYDPTSKEAYSKFRHYMLESVKKSNEGTNIKMRRVSKNSNLPTSTMDDRDAAYWERRRKNNEAAKRSRDARRAKEDEIAIRAAFLEQENLQLKYEITALRSETARLRSMPYTTT